MEKTNYFFNKGMRYVNPYDYKFQTFTKGRWIGRSILEVFQSEFKAYSAEYYVF